MNEKQAPSLIHISPLEQEKTLLVRRLFDRYGIQKHYSIYITITRRDKIGKSIKFSHKSQPKVKYQKNITQTFLRKSMKFLISATSETLYLRLLYNVIIYLQNEKNVAFSRNYTFT